MGGKDGRTSSFEMDGNVSASCHLRAQSRQLISSADIILAACDVEGNFLVVKVSFHT